jgi:alpha-1,6-mannosyltransferase
VGAGSGVMLAVAAWLAGALPSGDPAAWTVSYVAGLVCWAIGGTGIAFAWIKAETPLWAKAAWALPLVFSPPLGSRDIYAYACQGWLWLNGFDPYTTGVADAGCPWTEAVPQLWWHTPTPYGPFAIVLEGLAAKTGSLLGAMVVLRALAIAGAVIVAWALPRFAERPNALLLGIVTPLVAVHGISGAHNDMLVAAGVVGALAAAKAQKPVTAGIAIGLAVAIKVTAIVALPFLLIMLGKRWWASFLAGIATFAAVTLASGLGLGWVEALRHTGELTQWSSVPTAVGMAIGYLTSPQAIPIARAVGLIALAGVGLALLRWAWRDRARALPACGWMLAATALLGPVFYPWYALVPLGVLAAVEVREKLLITATLICTFLTLPNGQGIPALTKAPGAYAVTAVLIAVAIRTVRKRRPGPAA